MGRLRFWGVRLGTKAVIGCAGTGPGSEEGAGGTRFSPGLTGALLFTPAARSLFAPSRLLFVPVVPSPRSNVSVDGFDVRVGELVSE